MKKYLTFLILVILFVYGCSEEREGLPEGKVDVINPEIFSQDEKEYEKAGEMNILERKTFSAFFTKENQVADKEYFVESVLYNEKGNKLKQARFLTNGALDLEWDYKYDKEGNLVELTSKDMFDNILYHRESKYDQWGNELERDEFDLQQKGEFDVKFYYTLEGFLIEKRSFGKEEKLKSREEYKYQGNFMVMRKSYGDDGKLFEEKKYFYDGLNNLIMEVTYSPPNFRDTIKYLYDEKSRLIKVSTYYKQEFSYNDDDNVSEEWYYNQFGNLQQYITYEYNDKGLLKNKVKHDGMKTPVLNIRYEYDYYVDQQTDR